MRHHKQVNLAEHDEASEHYDHWCSGVSCATQDVGINLVDAAENVERGEQIQEQGSVTNHSCLLVKQIDHLRGENQQRNHHHNGYKLSKQECGCSTLLCTVNVAGTDVLSGEGGRSKTNTHHRQHHKLVDFHAGTPACHNIRAEYIDIGLHENVGNGSHHLLDRCRQSDADDAVQQRPVHAELFPTDAVWAVCCGQHIQRQNRRKALCNNGCKRHTLDSHAEGNDKQKIEHGIDNSGKNQEIQRMAGIADSAENAGAHVVEHQTGNTAKVNFKIRCRLTDDIVRCAHHAEHVRRDENAENGKGNGENKRHHQCRADGAADLFIRLCAIILRDNDTGTGGKSHEKADQRIDDRTDGADGGECFLADKVADNDAVNGVVKLLEEISGHQRKREEKKLFPDRALGHIAGFALLYCFRHSSPLFYVDFTFFFIVAL